MTADQINARTFLDRRAAEEAQAARDRAERAKETERANAACQHSLAAWVAAGSPGSPSAAGYQAGLEYRASKA